MLYLHKPNYVTWIRANYDFVFGQWSLSPTWVKSQTNRSLPVFCYIINIALSIFLHLTLLFALRRGLTIVVNRLTLLVVNSEVFCDLKRGNYSEERKPFSLPNSSVYRLLPRLLGFPTGRSSSTLLLGLCLPRHSQYIPCPSETLQLCMDREIQHSSEYFKCSWTLILKLYEFVK